MWREGLTLALGAWSLQALALMFGAYLGLRGLFDPRWAQRLVRLQADEQSGGFAEFRATYGGLFLAVHLAALFFTIKWIIGGEITLGVFATGAAAVASAAWFGAAAGRALSMWRDGTRTPFNEISCGIECSMGILVGAPWLLWFFSPPG